MAIDRAATLRNAEKLLRTGKLEPAIAEYLRVVEAQPQDWNTANILGYLGVKMLENIEHRWDNPTEEEQVKLGRKPGEGHKKLFEVREFENDRQRRAR